MKSLILINLLIVFATPLPAAQVRSSGEKSLEKYQAEAAEYIRQGRRQEAIDALRQVLRLKPDDATTHYSLGIELNAVGLFQEASEAFSKAIQLAPAMAEAHRELC